MRLLCLASGRGTNFEAIVHACKSNSIPHSEVVGLLGNQPDAAAVEIARREKIPVQILSTARFRDANGKIDRVAFDKELARVAKTFAPDWVCLTGYMLLLGKPFIGEFAGKILNIHPSLLPQFPGLYPQRQALHAKAGKTGCTVHLVDETLDGGPILEQTELAILPDDTEASLTERLLPVEHATYIRVLKRLAGVGYVQHGG